MPNEKLIKTLILPGQPDSEVGKFRVLIKHEPDGESLQADGKVLFQQVKDWSNSVGLIGSSPHRFLFEMQHKVIPVGSKLKLK